MKLRPDCCNLAKENIEFYKGEKIWHHFLIADPFKFCPYCGHKFIDPVTSEVKECILAKITEQARNMNYTNVAVLKETLRILEE